MNRFRSAVSAAAFSLVVSPLTGSCADPASGYTPPLREGALDESPSSMDGVDGDGRDGYQDQNVDVDVNVPVSPGNPGPGMPGAGPPPPGTPGSSGTTDRGLCGKLSWGSSLNGTVNVDTDMTVPVMGNIHIVMSSSVQMSFQYTAQSYTHTMRQTVNSFTPKLMENQIKDMLGKISRPRVWSLVGGIPGPDWQGLECLVLPMTEMKKGEMHIRYSPAIPASFVPWAEPSRLKNALATPRTFHLQVQVLRLDESTRSQKAIAALEGQTLQGTVTLSSVTPPAGDFGFRITADFGSADANTLVIGYREIDYYFDTTTQKFVGGRLAMNPMDGMEMIMPIRSRPGP